VFFYKLPDGLEDAILDLVTAELIFPIDRFNVLATPNITRRRSHSQITYHGYFVTEYR